MTIEKCLGNDARERLLLLDARERSCWETCCLQGMLGQCMSLVQNCDSCWPSGFSTDIIYLSGKKRVRS